jgi:hypothetical protein
MEYADVFVDNDSFNEEVQLEKSDEGEFNKMD